VSIAKIQTVQRSRKEYVCEKCRDVLPVGSQYRHYTVGFRSKYKHVRCMKDTCFPRSSELESSRLSDVYAAQENAEDQLNALALSSTPDDISAILEELASAIREVAEEYEAAAENEYGVVFNQDSADRAEILQSAADEIENYDPESDFEECEDCEGTGDIVPEDEEEAVDGNVECLTCDGTGKLLTGETIDAIVQFITGVELP
jgi:hypothetical protein